MQALVPLASPFPLLHPCWSCTCFQPDINAHTLPARSPLGTALVTQLVSVSSGPTFIWTHFFLAQLPLPSAGVWTNSTVKSFSQGLLQNLNISSTRSCSVLQQRGSDNWVGSEIVHPLSRRRLPMRYLSWWINIICAQGFVNHLCITVAQLLKDEIHPPPPWSMVHFVGCGVGRREKRFSRGTCKPPLVRIATGCTGNLPTFPELAWRTGSA